MDKASLPTAKLIVSTGTASPDGTGTFTGYEQGSLSIQIYSPQDGELFNSADIQVTGKAPPETVISLNDQIVLVPASGIFSIPVSLEEGPNILELVASDSTGAEMDIILTVVYEP